MTLPEPFVTVEVTSFLKMPGAICLDVVESVQVVSPTRPVFTNRPPSIAMPFGLAMIT